jgi:magnesium chelatase family protein
MHQSEACDKPSHSSQQLHNRVRNAFLRQKRRGQKQLNGSLGDNDIIRYCPLDDEGQAIIDQAISRFGLSFRAVGRILKVARTIADLEESDAIQKGHLMEALSYRKR